MRRAASPTTRRGQPLMHGHPGAQQQSSLIDQWIRFNLAPDFTVWGSCVWSKEQGSCEFLPGLGCMNVSRLVS